MDMAAFAREVLERGAKFQCEFCKDGNRLYRLGEIWRHEYQGAEYKCGADGLRREFNLEGKP
jgi:hypothetical protein